MLFSAWEDFKKTNTVVYVNMIYETVSQKFHPYSIFAGFNWIE